ncbi:MAG: transcription initiation factor IIB [Thermoplasmatota archaeon]
MENELNINNKKNKRGDAVEKVTECPECGSRHLAQDYDRGELICEDCGLVIDNQYIDEGPEWRAFDMKQEENRARTGAPMTQMVHDKGLSTGIDSSNRDSYGRSIPSKKKAQIYRLRKWQRRIRVSDATERNLAYALTEMDRMASTMGLPKNIRETAAVIYRKAVKKNLIRGRSINSVVAASLYAACRKAGVPRTLDEIAEATSSDRKEIGRTYRFLSRELVLKLKPTKPQEYLSRFCSELGLSGKVQKLAKNIIDKAEDRELISGKGPTGLAAASIYIASINANERRTQREVADVAAVTEVTVRNRYKELVEKLDIDIEV